MKILRFSLLAGALALLFAVGCGPKKTVPGMTEGHGVVFVSDAVFDFARYLANAFETTYNNAFVDLKPYPGIMSVDSLLNERTDQILLDRGLMPAESAAFSQANLKLYTYKVAYHPVFLLVPKSNPVAVIDSAALRGVLTGSIRNWKDLGGPDQRLHLYVPSPGEGAWVSLLNYYGKLDSITAIPCSTAATMLDTARSDPGALLAYSKPIDSLRTHKALDFHRQDEDISPNYKTILDTLSYPFRLDITYITTHQKEDVAAGYLTYIMGNIGQRRIGGELKYRPAAIPVRFVKQPAQ
ncbi:MAG TPA: substrate-binding domain-containing protein [bacterium]|jgi:phosphate transport system substrate-binding protein